MLSTLLLPTLVALVTACSDNGPADPDDDGSTPAITISLGASTLTIEQGQEGAVQVSLTRTGGFTGPVAVEIDGLSPGVNAPAAQIAAGSSQATLTVTAGAGAVVGATTATVRATAAGVATATASLALEVQAAPVGSFDLSVSPATITLQQGTTGQATLNITRTDPFGGPVQVAATAPSGLTLTGLESAVSGAEATLTVAAAAGLAPGGYTITLVGSADVVSDAVTSLDVTVTAAPAGSGVTWGFCDDAPVWFAVKNGAGAWARIAPSGPAADQFSFAVTHDRLAVAVVWARGSDYETSLFLLGRDEAALLIESCPTYRSVSGNVVGLAIGQLANITLGRDATTLTGGAGSTFTFDRVIEGATDFFASLIDMSGGAPVAQKLFFQRDIDPAPGAGVTVDFTGPDAFAPSMINVTASNVGGDQSAALTSLSTPTIAATLYTGAAAGAGPSWTVPVVPQSRLRSGDLQIVGVTALSSSAPLSDSRGSVKYFTTVGDQSLALGPYLGTVDVTTVQSAPYVRARVEYTRQPEYMGHLNVAFDQPGRNVTMWITDDWLGTAPALDAAIPDFSSVDGWNDLWGLQGGVATTWIVNANGWSSGPGTIGPDTFVDGLEVRSGIRIGQIQP